MTDRGPIFAALDYGTGGAKCALFDARGRCLAVAREAWTYTEAPHPNHAFNRGYSFEPAAFWAAVCRCARQATTGAGVAPSEIRGVACTAQRLGTIFLDGSGREVFAAPNMDGRGFSGAMEIISKLGMERGVAISGHWPPFVSSLARYLAYREQPELPAVRSILTLSDWLAYRLTGVAVSEPSNACESVFLDVSSRSWSAETLETFNVDPALLPPLVEPATRIGAVTAAAAAESGFAAGTPVFAGGGDTQCALLGSDVVSPGRGAAVLGTTTPVMVVTERPELDATGKLWTGCHVLRDRWTVESNAGDTGIAYQWLVELFGLMGDSGFAQAEAEIAALPPEPQLAQSFVGPQIFDLINMSFDRATGFLFRVPMFTERPGRSLFLRAFQENVACAVRANLEQVEEMRGGPAESLTLSGGMTRSPGLKRAFARLLHRPLLVSEEPNATALGAAVLAAAGLGTYRSVAEAASAMVRRHPLEPEAALRDAYDAHYRRWRELYDQLGRTPLY